MYAFQGLMFIKIMDAFLKQKVQIIHDIMLTLVVENLVDRFWPK